MALPVRTDDPTAAYHQCLVAVADVVGIAVVPEPALGDERRWNALTRMALRESCRNGLRLSDASFDVLIKAAVYDPDPSLNRLLVEPALNAFGRRRVRSALLDYLRTGTDGEAGRRCASMVLVGSAASSPPTASRDSEHREPGRAG
jgi:hypothetical protein